MDEYIRGGWTRWVHIHEEIAFDRLESIQAQVVADGLDEVVMPKTREQQVG